MSNIKESQPFPSAFMDYYTETKALQEQVRLHPPLFDDARLCWAQMTIRFGLVRFDRMAFLVHSITPFPKCSPKQRRGK
jgi:hypothetical protein